LVHYLRGNSTLIGIEFLGLLTWALPRVREKLEILLKELSANPALYSRLIVGLVMGGLKIYIYINAEHPEMFFI